MLNAFAGADLLRRCYAAAVGHSLPLARVRRRAPAPALTFPAAPGAAPPPAAGEGPGGGSVTRDDCWPTTVLVTLTGRDRPGVTSRLFTVLAAHELAVADIEQVVIRGRLVLGVLLACEGDPDLTAIHRASARSPPTWAWKRRSPWLG